jgi:hypothetical protein
MNSSINYTEMNSENSVYSRLDFSENLSSFLSPSEIPCSNFLSSFKTKFVLLHTGRCGSTLLHSALKPFVCPPFEIFNPFANDLILKELNTSLPVPVNEYINSYLKVVNPDRGSISGDMVLSISATPWVLDGVERISPGFCAALFSGATIVILRRGDILRQAISYVLAEKNDFWHAVNDNEISGETTVSGISRIKVFEYLDLILWGESRIFFSGYRDLLDLADCYELIEYENLSKFPEKICSKLLKLVGIKTTIQKIKKTANFPRKIYSDSVTKREVKSLLDAMPFSLPSRFTVSPEFLSIRAGWTL